MCADCLPAWAGFAFTFAFTRSNLATPQERKGEQGRVAVGAVGKEWRGGAEAQNFRHQKELLSIITGLAPKELHFAGCVAASVLLFSLFYCLNSFYLRALKFCLLLCAYRNALFYFSHNFYAFFTSVLCVYCLRFSSAMISAKV